MAKLSRFRSRRLLPVDRAVVRGDILLVGGGGAGGGFGTKSGGGGGGGAHYSQFAGAGGSGVVKVRYPNTLTIAATSGNLDISTQTSGAYKISTFISGTGVIRFNS